MKSIIFDTGALTLFYDHDPRVGPFVASLDSGKARCYVSPVTLSEFYYRTCATLGKEVAGVWATQIQERMEVLPGDPRLWISSGLEKCRNTKLSLADAYALALVKSIHGTLLTTDSVLAKSEGCDVRHFPV
ncbi:MAG: PIN domain-containing protein [Thaumarchaeota archaeon]|nr:PIN domain-containing protein [Nitrososphaerota archaeon]